MNVIVDENTEIENELLKTTLKDLFNFLHCKMDATGKPVCMGVMYEDIVFEIKCKPVVEKVYPRGYEK